MQSQSQRYVFIEYEDLKRIKFKKLEKVCSKMFVLVDAEEEGIPLSLVQQTQRLGKRLKWIPVNHSQDEDMAFHLAFLMGRTHQKVNRNIEFAILSNDTTFDPLVAFINSEGRNCLRVKRKRTKIEEEITESIQQINQNIEPFEVSEDPLPEEGDYEESIVLRDDNNETVWVEKTARETVKRLIRSGNRPSDLSLLKSYILLHNQELTDGLNIEKILARLQETKEIQIENQDVVYNF